MIKQLYRIRLKGLLMTSNSCFALSLSRLQHVSVETVRKECTREEYEQPKTDPEIWILVNGTEPVYIEVKKYISANDTDKNTLSINICPWKTRKVVIQVRNAETNHRKNGYAIKNQASDFIRNQLNKVHAKHCVLKQVHTQWYIHMNVYRFTYSQATVTSMTNDTLSEIHSGKYLRCPLKHRITEIIQATSMRP